MLSALCKYVQRKVSLIFKAVCIQSMFDMDISSEWLKSHQTLVKFYHGDICSPVSADLHISWSKSIEIKSFSRKTSVHLAALQHWLSWTWRPTQKITTSMVTNVWPIVCPGLVCGSGATSQSHLNKHKFISYFKCKQMDDEFSDFAGTWLKLQRCTVSTF